MWNLGHWRSSLRNFWQKPDVDVNMVPDKCAPDQQQLTLFIQKTGLPDVLVAGIVELMMRQGVSSPDILESLISPFASRSNPEECLKEMCAEWAPGPVAGVPLRHLLFQHFILGNAAFTVSLHAADRVKPMCHIPGVHPAVLLTCRGAVQGTAAAPLGGESRVQLSKWVKARRTFKVVQGDVAVSFTGASKDVCIRIAMPGIKLDATQRDLASFDFECNGEKRSCEFVVDDTLWRLQFFSDTAFAAFCRGYEETTAAQHLVVAAEAEANAGRSYQYSVVPGIKRCA